MPNLGQKQNKIRAKSNKKLEDSANKYFNCNDKERAAFEAGIKLGAIFHQFVGTPVGFSNVEQLENAIKKSILVQPFVEDAEIIINRNILRDKQHQFDYISLTGDMIKINLRVRFKNIQVQAKMKFIKDMNYPLMYITSIKEL